MNTTKTNNIIVADVTACRPPSKIGCVTPPVAPSMVTQCRPPSKIGCVITGAPTLQGEVVKPVTTQPVQPCGESYTAELGAPDIGLIFTVLVAGIFGNCR